MRATITRPDGTRIETEGTPEEIAKLAPPPAPFVPVPIWRQCTCGVTFAWCPLHGVPWRYPGTFIWGARLNAAASVPDMGQVRIGEPNAAVALPPPTAAAACAPYGGTVILCS